MTNRPTRAIVLGAGEGQRLRPHTESRPKCLVELEGRSLLDWGLGVLARHGIDDITVVTGYRGDAVEALGLTTAHNARFSSTNMVASLMCARDKMDGKADVLVLYADVVYEDRLMTALLNTPNDAASMVVNTEWLALWKERLENPMDDVETLILDDDGCITELGKKPTSYDQVQGQFTGLMRFPAELAARIPEVFDALDSAGPYDGKDRDNMYMTSFLQHWIDNIGRLRAVQVAGGWLEVDTVEDLELYQRLVRENGLDAFCRLPRANEDGAAS